MRRLGLPVIVAVLVRFTGEQSTGVGVCEIARAYRHALLMGVGMGAVARAWAGHPTILESSQPKSVSWQTR